MRIISNTWNYTATDEPQPCGNTWVKEKLITTIGSITLQLEEEDWSALVKEKYTNPATYVVDWWDGMKRETRHRLFPATIGYPESESVFVAPVGRNLGMYQLWP